MARSVQILESYGWSSWTTRTINSQWRVWQEFCIDDNRQPLPVTEAHFVAFIGWLYEERRVGRRRIGSSSIPQYFSAFRQRQLTTAGNPVPDFPYVKHVLRAFSRWEEQEFPVASVRVVINASQIKAIWELGMTSQNRNVIRDAAMCVFAYSLNGLRESSVASLLANNVSFTADSMTARLSVIKGRASSRQQLVSFTGIVTASPLNIWIRYSRLREEHVRYFAQPTEPTEWQPRSLNAALQRCLAACDIEAPVGGKYSVHSLRIGSHTEQVLLGIPLEVRMAHFGWYSKASAINSLVYRHQSN